MVNAHELKSLIDAAHHAQAAEPDARPELAPLRRVWAIAAAPVAAGLVGLVVNIHEPQLALLLALASLATVLWGEGPLQVGGGLALVMALGVVARGLDGSVASLIPFVVAAATAPGRSWVAWIIHIGVCGAASLFAIKLLAAMVEVPVLGVLAWGVVTFAAVALSHRIARAAARAS